MKKAFVFLILALMVFLFFSSDAAAAACREGIDLFCIRVLPILLPFLIAAGTLSRLGAAELPAKYLAKPFACLFRLPAEASFVFFSGILCGNPIAAQLAADLHARGILDARQTIRTTALCSFVSPAFLFGTVSCTLLQAPAAAGAIALGHYAGAVITGILFSRLADDPLPAAASVSSKRQDSNPVSALMQSVSAAASVLPQICVFIAFFSVLDAALQQFGFYRLLDTLATAFSLNAALVQALFRGFFEMTAGCVHLSTIALAPHVQYACISALLSFGGLCILCQNAACTSECGGRHIGLLTFRLVHAALAFFLTYCVSLLR